MDRYTEESYEDLLEDHELYIYLLEDLKRKIGLIGKQITKASYKNNEFSSSYINCISMTEPLLQKQKILLSDFEKIIKYQANRENLTNAQSYRNSIYYNQRILSKIIPSILVSTDWQSPTYLSSQNQQAGRLTGKIEVSYNDYKRDHHDLSRIYEREFLKENIDSKLKIAINVYSVNTGMAAFTTVQNFLLSEKLLSGKILIGKSTYWEIREIMKRMFPDNLIEFDESDLSGTINNIKFHKPSALFIDSVGNNPGMVLPDINKIVEYTKNLNNFTLVLDNASMATKIQPLRKYNPINLKNNRLIVIESLNKLHQFGLDRSFGGIIYAAGRNSGKIFTYRTRLGTIIGDSQVLSIPTPNRKIFDKRLKRLERNNRILSGNIRDVLNNKHPLFSDVEHPGQGVFFMLKTKNNSNLSGKLKNFVKLCINNSKNNKLSLHAGTSFGLPQTRIYPTALRSEITKPFVRISAGTESLSEIYNLSDFFKTIL